MTPEQTKRRIPVMQKFGEPGWKIGRKYITSSPCGNYPDWVDEPDPSWDSDDTYRAVRVETAPGKRVPMPWSVIKCGMTIRDEADKLRSMTVLEMSDTTLWCGRGSCRNRVDFTSTEYLDGSTWKPLWTDVPCGERIVEIISEEGV